MRVAVAQIDPKLAEVDRNLATCLQRLDEAANQGAQLLVLPECAISGYMFDSAEEALPFAEEIPGPSSEVMERECRRLACTWCAACSSETATRSTTARS